MRERHVSPHSVINRVKRRLSDERGPFINDRKPWTVEHMELLLDGYFKGWGSTSPNPNAESFQSVLSRCPKSMEMALYKIGVCYPGFPPVRSYRPKNRIDRTDTPLVFRDYEVFTLALNPKGRLHNACEPAYLSRILGRSEKEVRRILTAWERQSKQPPNPMFPYKKVERLEGETPDQYRARLVFKTVVSLYKKTMKLHGKEYERPFSNDVRFQSFVSI